jgi:PAS domain-containing protein
VSQVDKQRFLLHVLSTLQEALTMEEQDKTRDELSTELEALRRRVSELEQSEARLKRTERLLTESQERFRLLYENAPLGYQSLDENGYLLEVNHAWLDAVEYSHNEVTG